MNSWSLEPEGYWEQPWASLALPIGSSMYRSLPFEVLELGLYPLFLGG